MTRQCGRTSTRNERRRTARHQVSGPCQAANTVTTSGNGVLCEHASAPPGQCIQLQLYRGEWQSVAAALCRA